MRKRQAARNGRASGCPADLLRVVPRVVVAVALALTGGVAGLAPSAAMGSLTGSGECVVISDALQVSGGSPSGPSVGSVTRGRTFFVMRRSPSGRYSYGHSAGRNSGIEGWVLSAALRPLVLYQCKRTPGAVSIRVQRTDCAHGRAVYEAWASSPQEQCRVGWLCVLTVGGEEWRCAATIYARHRGSVNGRIGCYQLPQLARVRIYYLGHAV